MIRKKNYSPFRPWNQKGRTSFEYIFFLENVPSHNTFESCLKKNGWVCFYFSFFSLKIIRSFILSLCNLKEHGGFLLISFMKTFGRTDFETVLVHSVSFVFQESWDCKYVFLTHKRPVLFYIIYFIYNVKEQYL